MKHIIKKLALLFVPVYLWFAFFVAFEPNNYFWHRKKQPLPASRWPVCAPMSRTPAPT